MRASRTAVIVAQGRAAADGRVAVGRFADPVAAALLTPAELVPVTQVRAGEPPAAYAERAGYETVRATAEVVVPRTVTVDEAVLAAPAGQVVLLGAGLDARAHRLALPAVFEVDHPASQADKRARVAGVPVRAASLAYVPVDLALDPLGPALAAAGHSAAEPTVWVWEGVLPYLRAVDAGATAAAVAALSAPGSTLVVQYQTPGVAPAAGRLIVRGMSALARRPSPWRDEPYRSSWSPAALRCLLDGCGFTVASDTDLLTVATALATPTRGRTALRTAHVTVATR